MALDRQQITPFCLGFIDPLLYFQGIFAKEFLPEGLEVPLQSITLILVSKFS
jgi:hypothetical protein